MLPTAACLSPGPKKTRMMDTVIRLRWEVTLMAAVHTGLRIWLGMPGNGPAVFTRIIPTIQVMGAKFKLLQRRAIKSPCAAADFMMIMEAFAAPCATEAFRTFHTTPPVFAVFILEDQ